jgi:hypothetical protein
MKIREIITESYFEAELLNIFYNLLTGVTTRMDEAEFLAGNNDQGLNLPTAMPQDWAEYKTVLGGDVENLSPIKTLVMSEHPAAFDSAIAFKIERLVANIEERYSRLP